MNSSASWWPLKGCPIRRTTNNLPTQTLKLWLQRAQQDLWSKASAENHILMRSPSTLSRSPLVSQQMRWSGPSCSVSVEAEFQNTAIPGTGAGRGGGVWRRADQIGIRECHGSVGAERGGRKHVCWFGVLVCARLGLEGNRPLFLTCHLREVILALAELRREH